MLNFELYNPTQYVFGKDQTQKLATLVPQNAKVLLAFEYRDWETDRKSVV